MVARPICCRWGSDVKTKFGELSISAVLSRIDEYRFMGEAAFLREYANGRGAKSTWISYEGEFFPAKAIFRAAFLPTQLPPTFQTSDTYVLARELGLKLKRVEPGDIQTGRSAIEDLDDEVGNDDPEYQVRIAGTYIRKPEVRNQVLKRANGKCEYKGCKPFSRKSGEIYLETHHVIHLSHKGADKATNVIALCPNHHREAHFGKRWKTLQDEFLQILARSV